MHEIGIANTILEAVKAESRLRPGSVPCKVAMRIGELVAVDPDALRFAFEVLSRDTELHDLQLEIETPPIRHRCRECKLEFRVIEFDPHCPRCGQESTECTSGDQLEIAYIEMETYEPSTA